ncbi:hypothetical protein Tco_1543339, partial [Tanacetum coccineum]
MITDHQSQNAIHNQLDTLCMNNADSVQRSNDAKVNVNPIIAHRKDVKTVRVPLEREAKLIKSFHPGQ